MRSVLAVILALTAIGSASLGLAEPAAADHLDVMSGIVDASRVEAPRWTAERYVPAVSGQVEFELTWIGGGDLAFDLRLAGSNAWVASNTSGDHPKIFTAEVEAGVVYSLAVWARSGEGSFRVTADGQAAQQSLLAGAVDASRATAPRWVSTSYVATETESVTFELDWVGQGNLAIDVRLAATGRWIGSQTGSAKPKSLTVPLEAGTRYQIAVWALTGVGEFELTRRLDHTEPPATAPNIVVINLDDARPEALETMSSVQRWLIDGGTNYVNAYVAVPSCCPSRATLMTGQYGHNNSQQDHYTPSTNEDQTIQRYLSDAGYFTAHSGKYLHYYETAERAPHWDRWTYFRGGYYDVWINVDGTVFQSPRNSTKLTFDSVLANIESFDEIDDDRPFYIQATPIAPHSPWIPESQYQNAAIPEWAPNPSVGETDRWDKPPWVRYLDYSPAQAAVDRIAQLRTLLTVDDQVDRLMQRLDDLGELDNTLVIFTSDNGLFWAEHGRSSKFLPYREANEVPFVVRWPGHVEAGRTSTDLVSHVDILATVLSAAGVEPGHVTDGRDILDPGFARSNLLIEYWEDESNGNFIPTWASIRNQQRMYAEYYDEAGDVIFVEFYDLVDDPWEMTNLMADGNPNNNPNLAWVSSELFAARNCRGTACP